jgi:16S rRNA (adenine1518-N6/adenine1519-N6)-dimethyltransferase
VAAAPLGRSALEALGIRPDTRLGQHFLVDRNIVDVALRLAALGPDDVAVEVGPGAGVLTSALAARVRAVHAIELDRRLEAPLQHVLAGLGNVRITWADALRVDLEALDPKPTAMVANLPYNVATPLVVESLGRAPSIGTWCVMVQREVADRFFATERTPAYGAVSVLIRLATVRTGFHPVPRTVFVPPPNVESALVAFRRRPGWAVLAPTWRQLAAVVHAAFAHRRKTLANSVSLAGLAPRARVEQALAELELPAAVRAEALPPETFPPLARRLTGDAA